jgi:hypothetical protein
MYAERESGGREESGLEGRQKAQEKKAQSLKHGEVSYAWTPHKNK